MKSIVDGLGRQEKAKQVNLWDWIKNKTNIHIGAYRTVNS